MPLERSSVPLRSATPTGSRESVGRFWFRERPTGHGTPAKPCPILSRNPVAEREHYAHFRWPWFSGSRSESQRNAVSWIARQRLHIFWEAVRLLIVFIGLALLACIFIKALFVPGEEPQKIEIVNRRLSR